MIVLPVRMEFIKSAVTLCSRIDTQEVRNAYNQQLRDDFKNFALRILMSDKMWGIETFPMDQFDALQIHHIKPISLGGTNKFSNLALVDPELHREIHREIDLQTSGMKYGDTRKIDLPYFSGILWTIENV